MTDQPRHRDELEQLIAEAQDLEQAGVFKRTPVNVASLVETHGVSRRPRLTHRLFVGLQVAACLGLVVGLATMWRAGSSSPGPAGLTNSSDLEVAGAWGGLHCERVETLKRCFSGPAGDSLGEECKCVDFDDDGDVDLADYGAFQRHYVQSP
ncbi:MAG: hypothetical protein ACYS7M_08455 [Planctomycetota bacterium]|jgi:hypothetical protein